MSSRKLIVFVAALLVTVGLSAQNMTSSPFSRYAYGDINENVPTAFRSMGGVGIGMRDDRAINPSQPASFTVCDSLTFMMDIAACVNWSRYRDAGGMKNKRKPGVRDFAVPALETLDSDVGRFAAV